MIAGLIDGPDDWIRVVNVLGSAVGLVMWCAVRVRDGDRWRPDFRLLMAANAVFLTWSLTSAVEGLLSDLPPGPRIYVQVFAVVWSVVALTLTWRSHGRVGSGSRR